MDNSINTLTTLKQYYGAVSLSFLLALLVIVIAKKNGFFKLSKASSLPSVSFAHLIGGLLTYIVSSLVIVPFVLLAILYIQKGKLVDSRELANEIWWPAVSLAVIFVCLLLYIFFTRKSSKAVFWGVHSPSSKALIKPIGWGLVAWIVSYPCVIFMGLLGSMISLWLWNKSGVQQTAIQYLLNALPYPFLYIITSIFIVTIVPITEEFLFRGLLQSFLRRFLGRIGAIVVTAIVFSFVHFSPSQGTGNLELILSLFVLACFLGFIYEREQSLWAPIGLHMAFNAFSVIMLSFM